MRRFAFKSKIHRATVTDANVDYEGSLSVDEDLLEAADIMPYEQLHVWDVTNGARLVTYALPAPRGSGTVQVNGGGAHHVRKGDLVIVATFTMMPSRRLKKYRPTVIFVDENNRIKPPPAAAAPAPEPPVDEATETPEAEPGRETLRRKKKR